MDRELKNTEILGKAQKSSLLGYMTGRRRHNMWRQGMWGGPWRNMQQRKSDEGSRHQGKKIVKDSYMCRIVLSASETHCMFESEDPRWIGVSKQITEEKISGFGYVAAFHCALSVCGESLALFLEIYEKQLSLYWHLTNLDVTYFLGCYDNNVGSFEKFLVIVWKWAHQKWSGNAQQEQRFKWSCIFLLCCCSYSCLVLQLKRRKTMAKLSVSF